MNFFRFDLRMSNVNDANIDKMNEDTLPDVVLVKKVYADKATRNARRRWKLKHLALNDDTGSQNRQVYLHEKESLHLQSEFKISVVAYNLYLEFCVVSFLVLRFFASSHSDKKMQVYLLTVLL